MFCALVVTGADGPVSVAGPYRSEAKARRLGVKPGESANEPGEAPGLTADVYEMDRL